MLLSVGVHVGEDVGQQREGCGVAVVVGGASIQVGVHDGWGRRTLEVCRQEHLVVWSQKLQTRSWLTLPLRPEEKHNIRVTQQQHNQGTVCFFFNHLVLKGNLHPHQWGLVAKMTSSHELLSSFKYLMLEYSLSTLADLHPTGGRQKHLLDINFFSPSSALLWWSSSVAVTVAQPKYFNAWIVLCEKN